jgi:hypothetical protein
LSAGKLARSRRHDIACAFVTHVGQVYNISVEGKAKGNGGAPTRGSGCPKRIAPPPHLCALY